MIWTSLLSLGLLFAAVGEPDPHPGQPTMIAHVGADTVTVDERPFPEDTYRDAAVRELVERARTARREEATEIESYEARMWERWYAGLSGDRFRRERTLFEQERAARVRWEAAGRRVVRWEGAYQAVPVAGQRSDRDESMGRSLAETLASSTGGSGPFFYEPGGERIHFAGTESWALHPLADTAGHHYRYRSGDTLRVTLPPDGRTVTMVEAIVEPRRSDYRLVAGSLWFDRESAELVRAAYRPARPFNLGTDAEEDGPRFLRDIEAEVRQVTVDYSLHDLRWWLPHRFALSLEVRAGRMIRMPIGVEWTVGDYRINEAESADLDTTPGGWTRNRIVRAVEEDDDGEPADSLEWVNLVPPADSLHLSPALTVRRTGAGPGAGLQVFSEDELREFREGLERIVPPGAVFQPRLRWGLEDGLVRYNRIEGLSLGVAGEAPLLPGYSGRAELRLGAADLHPRGELRVQRGAGARNESVAVYRRLAYASEWDDPLDFGSSLAALVAGVDRGEYYRADGAELAVTREARRGTGRFRLFAERHRTAVRNTDFHLTGLFNDDTLRTNLEAHEGDWIGGAVNLRGHRGLDPNRLRLFGTLRAETAHGDEGWYQRVAAAGGAAIPLDAVDLAVEVGGGSGWGALPPQRHFFLGGPGTLRGITPGSLVGESHWFARGEIARGFPAFRLVGFGDLGWAGPREDLGSGRPVRALGAGASVLDGILRLDLARSLGAEGRWRLHFYLDGLF